MKKIKIISGWTNPGGSTVALINLCNLFNDSGYDCTFYGPHGWHSEQCKSGHISNCPVNEPGEALIAHYVKLPARPERSEKVVLACHEKDVFPVKDIETTFWDDIVYVSNSQMFWQGVHGTVIPNVICDVEKVEEKSFIAAGVIGSIDENKNTHVSIERAVKDGHETIMLYGQVTDRKYYKDKVKKWVDKGTAVICGYENDRNSLYGSLSDVYHSSSSETFNYIKPECKKAGVEYHGLESSESGAEYWDTPEILSAWEEVLSLK
jgi:hypothetical protein